MTDAMSMGRPAGPGTSGLFVHLRLETREARPWLAHEDVAQAAQTALASEARMQRCRVLAIGGGQDHLHAVVSFPPSLPLNTLIRQMQHVSARAASRALAILGQAGVTPDALWSGRYQLDTLSGGDIAGLVEYVCRHPDVHARGEAQPQWERADDAGERRRASGSYIVRERSLRYRPR